MRCEFVITWDKDILYLASIVDTAFFFTPGHYMEVRGQLQLNVCKMKSLIPLTRKSNFRPLLEMSLNFAFFSGITQNLAKESGRSSYLTTVRKYSVFFFCVLFSKGIWLQSLVVSMASISIMGILQNAPFLNLKILSINDLDVCNNLMNTVGSCIISSGKTKKW